jgi:hypothetical protein
MRYWKRPLAFTVMIYCILIWGYCCLRMITCPSTETLPFVDGIPINMWETALGAFVALGVSCYYMCAS